MLQNMPGEQGEAADVQDKSKSMWDMCKDGRVKGWWVEWKEYRGLNRRNRNRSQGVGGEDWSKWVVNENKMRTEAQKKKHTSQTVWKKTEEDGPVPEDSLLGS